MTYEDIFENFKRYFPVVAKSVVEYHPDTIDTIILYTDKDERIIYDDSEHTIRCLSYRNTDLDKTEFSREFGRRLRKIMERRFMTQSEFADRLGLTQAQVSRYVRGRNIPDFYILDRMASVLDCSIDDLKYSE